MIIPLVGCSKSEEPVEQSKVKTPIQLLTDRVNASDTTNGLQTARLDEYVGRIATLETSSTYDPAPLLARLTALEALPNFAVNVTALEGSDTFINSRLSALESYNISANISARLAVIEARLNISATPTPTPTPTPTIQCGIHRPTAVYPTSGSMSVPNGSVLFQWGEEFNAVKYELFLGTDSSLMPSIKVITDYSVNAFLYPVPLADTYYFWKIVISDGCGNTQTDSWWFKTQ
jgi:hypothetical protein